jgi:hypothetical protein
MNNQTASSMAGIQQPVVVLQTTPGSTTVSNPGVNHTLAVKTAWVLGISHIIFGIIIFFFQIAATVILNKDLIDHGLAFLGTGIWCGLIIIINGVLGCCSASYKTNGFIKSFCVVSVFCVLFFAPFVILFSAAKFGIANTSCQEELKKKNCDFFKEVVKNCDILMLLASIAEFVLSIWSIVITCKCCCMCCHETSGTPQNVIYRPPNYQDPSVVNTGIVAPQQRPIFAFGPKQQGVPQPQMQQGVFPPHMQQGVFLPQMQQGVLVSQMQPGVPLPQMQQGGFPPQMQQEVPSPYMQQGVESVQQVSPSCPETSMEQPPWSSDPPPYKM